MTPPKADVRIRAVSPTPAGLMLIRVDVFLELRFPGIPMGPRLARSIPAFKENRSVLASLVASDREGVTLRII